MPEVFSATVAEREAELLALQSAFDEYIASSRELEEELDAELAKMREYNSIVSSENELSWCCLEPKDDGVPVEARVVTACNGLKIRPN